MYPQSIERLIKLFSQFPTIGPRTASRFVFYLLKTPQSDIDELISALQDLKSRIQLCRFCFRPFEKDGEQSVLCGICQNKTRNTSLLCIVEKESDLEALEKTRHYNGLYFILGGTVGMLKKSDLKNLRVEELKQRIKNPAEYSLPQTTIQEIIIATNPTAEGEATALYVERMLKNIQLPTSRLGRGLPIGGEIEYADEETLRSALEGRR